MLNHDLLSKRDSPIIKHWLENHITISVTKQVYSRIILNVYFGFGIS